MLNRYIIERKIPGVGESSEEDYSKLAGKSNEARRTQYQKLFTFVIRQLQVNSMFQKFQLKNHQ